MSKINHKDLLTKYLSHVGVIMGTCLLMDGDRGALKVSPEFTDAEWAELKKLEK